jgi:hypothetical protein
VKRLKKRNEVSMENYLIADKTIETIDKSKDNKIRFVAKVRDFDEKTGTFVVSGGSDKQVTCLPPVEGELKLHSGEIVLVTAKVMPTEEENFELMSEYVREISEREYSAFNKYLKTKETL